MKQSPRSIREKLAAPIHHGSLKSVFSNLDFSDQIVSNCANLLHVSSIPNGVGRVADGVPTVAVRSDPQVETARSRRVDRGDSELDCMEQLCDRHIDAPIIRPRGADAVKLGGEFRRFALAEPNKIAVRISSRRLCLAIPNHPFGSSASGEISHPQTVYEVRTLHNAGLCSLMHRLPQSQAKNVFLKIGSKK